MIRRNIAGTQYLITQRFGGCIDFWDVNMRCDKNHGQEAHRKRQQGQ